MKLIAEKWKKQEEDQKSISKMLPSYHSTAGKKYDEKYRESWDRIFGEQPILLPKANKRRIRHKSKSRISKGLPISQGNDPARNGSDVKVR
uniref:Uncharacterized protein n=1 Tax=viral metagenome TaxID=1070528 RepID=A0A6H2A1L6_9ZZZZ